MFWYEGALREDGRVPFDLSDRGLTLGDGLFDTSLAHNGRVFRRQAHLDRLAAQAATLGLAYDNGEAAQALDALAEAVGDGAIRLTVTRGSGPRGLRPPPEAKALLFGSAARGAPASAFAPVALATTPIRRNDSSPLARLKSLSYLDAILAAQTVAAQGADEALFENTRGCIACSATANIFVICGRRIVTPPLTDGVLAGTMRAYLLGLGSRAMPDRAEIVELSLSSDVLMQADAVFLTNSLRLLAPCTAIDGQRFDSADHPVVRYLQDEIRAAIVVECEAPSHQTVT